MTTPEEKMLLKPVLPSSQPCLAKSFARAIAAAHEMRTALNAFTRTDELARGMGMALKAFTSTKEAFSRPEAGGSQAVLQCG